MNYDITPVPAPRMVQSDKWNPRPPVLRYRAFRDECRLKGVYLPIPCHVTFYIEMPASWSKKRKAEMNGKPHTSKPDADNLWKALSDAVLKDDSHVWMFAVEKRWRDKPGIVVSKFYYEDEKCTD